MTRAPTGEANAGSPAADMTDHGVEQYTANAATPIDAVAFAKAMAAFSIPDECAIAVAVSGGPDSMALLLLLREWCARRQVTLTALTVDHCLRDESGTEAAQVAAWCEALGVAHAVLPWRMGPSQRGLSRSPQAAARAARYDLLLNWCHANGHARLCVAHHADDQIETFFLRLARGSGVDGLAAMAPKSRRAGVDLLRPLLSFRKNALEATCVAAGQGWVEDPSNGNRKSARVRFRQARAIFAAEGFDDARLLATIAHLQRARQALETAVDALLAQTCRWDSWGAAHIDLAAFVAAPAEIALRALTRVLTTTAGEIYGPRFERLERLYGSMIAGPWRDSTLHGCHIMRDGTEILICREADAITEDVRVNAGETVLWDRRFSIGVPHSAPCALVVCRLTAPSWKLVTAGGNVPAIHPAIRAGMPMMTDEQGLAAVPWAGYVRADLRLQLKEPIFWGFAPSLTEFG